MCIAIRKSEAFNKRSKFNLINDILRATLCPDTFEHTVCLLFVMASRLGQIQSHFPYSGHR